MAVVTPPVLSLNLRASSMDTQQRLPYNPHRTYPKKPPNLDATAISSNATPTITSISSANRTDFSVSDLLKRDTYDPRQAKSEDTYLGYEIWLPRPPKVAKPRSVYNAASLAYLGDCIYELYARRHFLFPPLNIEEYNDRVMAVVRCEAQDAMLQKLINDNFLSEEERNVIRWGKNISSTKTRSKRRAGGAIYNRASSLETLVGYLYLTNVTRLEEIMLNLGFSVGASTKLILEEINTFLPGKQ